MSGPRSYALDDPDWPAYYSNDEVKTLKAAIEYLEYHGEMH